MRVTLIIARYPSWAIPFGFLSMALFRLSLMWNGKVSFWRLMGSGKNGSFDMNPDLHQWNILIVHKHEQDPYLPEEFCNPTFIKLYHKLFRANVKYFLLEPFEGHGKWNGKEVFGKLGKQEEYYGSVAVLTRATIRLSKLKEFWKHVPLVAPHLKNAKGLLSSYGMGELPLIKQATFSIWENREAMKEFAYGMEEHKEVIRKSHTQSWYSEEMFVRFSIIKSGRSLPV